MSPYRHVFLGKESKQSSPKSYKRLIWTNSGSESSLNRVLGSFSAQTLFALWKPWQRGLLETEAFERLARRWHGIEKPKSMNQSPLVPPQPHPLLPMRLFVSRLSFRPYAICLALANKLGSFEKSVVDKLLDLCIKDLQFSVMQLVS